MKFRENTFLKKDSIKSLEREFQDRLKEKDLELEKISTLLEQHAEDNKEVQKLYENAKRNVEKLEKEDA